MNSIFSGKTYTQRKLILAVLAGLLVLALFMGSLGRAKADEDAPGDGGGDTGTGADTALEAEPGSGPLGATFEVNGTGFVGGEKLVLWTTDPNGQVLDAGYVFTDEAGNISLKIMSSDPNGVATNGNYTSLMQVATGSGEDGEVEIEEYWGTVLKQVPAAGKWHMTFKGSAVTLAFTFTITQ